MQVACVRGGHRPAFLGGGRCEALRPARSLDSSKTDKAGKEWSMRVQSEPAPELLTEGVRLWGGGGVWGKRSRRKKSVQAVYFAKRKRPPSLLTVCHTQPRYMR